MTERIYLDYAATTPLDDRVVAAMEPYFSTEFGNPSSIHSYGQRAEAAVDGAREKVASVLGCSAEEIIFTSCGSESDNLALRGASVASRLERGADRIATSRAEHHAVSKTAEHLAKYAGIQVDWLAVDPLGTITPAEVQRNLTDRTSLVSVMYANNEIGTINPVHQIAEVCHRRGALFHSDAVQAAAYLPVDVGDLGVDMMSLGGHKFFGPKGVGALYVKKGTPLVPAQTGGGQEQGLRAGTQNVPYIVGFAEALRLAVLERDVRTAHATMLRDRIIGMILDEIPDARLTGDPQHRLPNHASFVFKGLDGNLLLTLLDAAGFACSSGSACKTGNPEPSEVMAAIGLAPEWGLGSLRVTVGSPTTPSQVDRFLRVLPDLVKKARSLSHVAAGAD